MPSLGGDDEDSQLENQVEKTKPNSLRQQSQLVYFTYLFEIFLTHVNVSVSFASLKTFILKFSKPFFAPIFLPLLEEGTTWQPFLYTIMQLFLKILNLYDEVIFLTQSPYYPSRDFFGILGIEEPLSYFFGLLKPIRKKSLTVQYLLVKFFNLKFNLKTLI